METLGRCCSSLKSSRIVVVSVAVVQYVFVQMSYTIQAPFYPAVADAKGVSQSQYGFVFGIFELSSVIFSVPLGIFVSRLGAHLVYLNGLLLNGGACVLFGCLIYIEDSTTFLIYSFLIRIVESFGHVSMSVSTICILQEKYPNMEGSAAAISETAVAIGMISGSFIGGLLYDVGGFLLPFAFVGGVLLVSMIPSYFLFSVDVRESESKTKGFLWKILLVPKIWIGVTVNAVAIISGETFIMPTLEPHLRQFDLIGTYLGMIFLCNGAGYISSTLLWNYLCSNRKVSPYYLMIASFLIMSIGMSMIGPIPWLPVTPRIWLAVLGMILLGFGSGGSMISSLSQMIDACAEKGIPYDGEAKGIVSGMYLAGFNLGGFVGPSLGGVLSQFFGFRLASFVIVCLNLSVVAFLSQFVTRLCLQK